VVHNDVGAEAFLQPHAFVEYRYGNLTLKWNAGASQFVTETSFVRGLQQARPCFPMYLDRQPDHAFA